jgi:hypothetical protein
VPKAKNRRKQRKTNKEHCRSGGLHKGNRCMVIFVVEMNRASSQRMEERRERRIRIKRDIEAPGKGQCNISR